jgi:GH15 family glucan-1,4-alpha-glucosidase
MRSEPRIEDYAVIGDGRTAALVHSNGSIDWLCLPRFDSPACFAALLGDAGNGHWRIAPVEPVERVERRYRPDTLVLETEIECASGTIRLTDFMPMEVPQTSIVRLVTAVRGRVPARLELVIRFDYGRQIPWVSRPEEGTLGAIAGPHLLVLRTPVAHHGEDLKTVADFMVPEGGTIPFVLTYGNSFARIPEPFDPLQQLERTERHWTEWAARCRLEGPWRDAVVRSLITLKALTYAPTGGIVAAPTTSLPEQPGGTRNWDYRFCWLRDATFTLLALMSAGYRDEAEEWRKWLVHAVAGHPSQVQPLYSVLAETRADEQELPWLSGFGGAKPVRIGNAAFGQLQLDVFGEVLDALHHARRHYLSASAASWALQRALVDQVSGLLDVPDHGIWEVRGRPQHFTHSKVMMWVALDRAIKGIEHFGLDGPVERWRGLRDRLHGEICAKAYDPELGAFVQAYGSKELDAAVLLMPIVGFLPAHDPRIAGTVAAIERELLVDGFVQRYDSETVRDGLEPGEGTFIACTFWLADNLVLQGRREEAAAVFERVLAIRNDVGLLAEEYDVVGRRLLGNFPQALSHVSLVDTALNLRDNKGPARERSKHG